MTVDGDENFLGRGIIAMFEFFAEAGDVHIDGAGGISGHGESPDFLEKFLAGDGPMVVVGKVLEDLEFALTES